MRRIGIRNWRQFLNENKTMKEYDSFTINVKYDVDHCDIDYKNILLSALQKTYSGWSDIVIFNSWGFETKNSDIELKLINSKYFDETYEVIYNREKEYEGMDDEDSVFKFVKKSIESITYYSYRSVHSMDTRQRADIKILSITKI